jgi:hypothetical protein
MLFALANLYKTNQQMPAKTYVNKISATKDWKSWTEDDDSDRVKQSKAPAMQNHHPQRTRGRD